VEVQKKPSKAKIAKAVGGGEASDPLAQGFADLYVKHGGDLVAIFAVLGEDPGKALKYPPKDAAEFAAK